MAPSSLFGWLAGRWPGEMSGEECACLFCRILGGRLAVFDRVAKRATAGLQSGNIEGMVGVLTDMQRNRRAVGPRMGNHLATGVPPGSSRPVSRRGSRSERSMSSTEEDLK